MSKYVLLGQGSLGQMTPEQMVAEANRQVTAAQQTAAEQVAIANRIAGQQQGGNNLVLYGGIGVAAILGLWLARRSGWI